MSGLICRAMAIISGVLAISRLSRVLMTSRKLADVAILDVAAVFAQMGGDAVSAGGFADQRRLDGVRFAALAPAVARLAQGGDMINIDSEFEHGGVSAMACPAPTFSPWAVD